MILSFALSMAFLMAGPTSFPFTRPMPTKPSSLPTTTVMANLTLLPESVILWTMFTSNTSSVISGRSMSTISGSLRGNRELRASLMVVILPSYTSLPSFVLGTHFKEYLSSLSFSLRLPPVLGLNAIFPLLDPVHDCFEGLLHFLIDMRTLDPLLGGQHLLAVRDVHAGVQHAFERCEDL